MEKILKLLNDATYVVTYGRDLAEIELYINPNNGNTKVWQRIFNFVLNMRKEMEIKFYHLYMEVMM